MSNAAVLGAVFAALFAGHQIGDHICQTDKIADDKVKSGWFGWWAILKHLAGYHACIVAALFGLWLIEVPLTWAGVTAGLAFSAVTHGFLDRRWPVRLLLEKTGSARFASMTTPICGAYQADQSLHVAALFVSALLVVSIG